MSNVLERIIERKHYSFINGQGISWQEAVRLSALPLVEEGSVDKDYYKQILPCPIPLKIQSGHIRLL